jgi:hypothetical protein
MKEKKREKMIPGKKERKVTEDGNWQKKRKDGSNNIIHIDSDITERKKKERRNDIPAMNNYHINDV